MGRSRCKHYALQGDTFSIFTQTGVYTHMNRRKFDFLMFEEMSN